MRRRALLYTTATAAFAALAGCFDDEPTDQDEQHDDGSSDQDAQPDDDTGDTSQQQSSAEDDSQDERDPVAAVEAFFGALDDGNVDRANELIHPGGDLSEFPEGEAKRMDEGTMEVVETTVVEETDDTATLEGAVLTDTGPVDEPIEVSGTIELRTADGEWKLWEIEVAPEFRPPETEFDFDRTEDALVIGHTSGDAIPAETLHIRIEDDDMVSTEGWTALGGTTSGGSDDEPAVVAGDTVEIDVEPPYTVALIWEHEELNRQMTLASTAVDTASESDDVSRGEAPPAVQDHLEAVDNFDGALVDLRGESNVTVGVGEIEGVEPLFAFDPPAIHVETGTTVTWEWRDDHAHTVTHVDEEFDSGVLDGEGTTYEYTFEEPGIYLYICLPHEGLGHKGAVVVEGT